MVSGSTSAELNRNFQDLLACMQAKLALSRVNFSELCGLIFESEKLNLAGQLLALCFEIEKAKAGDLIQSELQASAAVLPLLPGIIQALGAHGSFELGRKDPESVLEAYIFPLKLVVPSQKQQILDALFEQLNKMLARV